MLCLVSFDEEGNIKAISLSKVSLIHHVLPHSQVHPSKVKKAAAKPAKRSAPASSTSTSSSALESQIPAEDPVKRGEELREKAHKDGTELRDAFWLNLAKAAEEPAQLVSDEKKKTLPRGIALLTEDETKASIAKAKSLFQDAKYAEVAEEIDSSLANAALDEELLGELYQIRGKARFHQKLFFEAVHDLSFAKHCFFTAEGETLFYRMRAYLELDLPLYATIDYSSLASDYSDYPDLKSFKTKVSSPIPHDLKKLTSKFTPGRPFMLPTNTSLVELVKVTIVLALQHNFGYEELGGFLYLIKSTGYDALSTPAKFGLYLRNVFSANDMEDISEVFTHFIPEHTVPLECTINEVMDAIESMGQGCHLIHRIGLAMCFSLAWTPTSMWNLHATLFKDHIAARFDYQRALWHDYHMEILERIQRGDDDLSYTCNGGIGEIPPPHARIDYLYVTDHAASDYIRLHAEATALKATEVLDELREHVPLNTFHVTLAPMIFAAARDAMPKSIKFMIEHGAEINIMDAAEETPLDAARVALEFRIEMLHDHGYIVPIEEFTEVDAILKGHGGKSTSGDGSAQSAFEQMFGGAGRSQGDDDVDDEEDEEHYGEYEEDGEEMDEEMLYKMMGREGFEEFMRAQAGGNFDETSEDEDEEE